MNKTSITKILIFFLLVGIEHINASSNNLRKRKTTTRKPLIDAFSSIFMKDDWTCCDGTNEPTPVPTVNDDVPTSSSTNPTFSVSPTSTPSKSPTYIEKKLTASDGESEDYFGMSCSMSGDLVVIGAPHEGTTKKGAAYLYHLNGNEVSKLTPGDNGKDYGFFSYSVSIDEKIVVGSYGNYVQVFSLEGSYERNITCDDCSEFGRAVGIHNNLIVTVGYQNSIRNLFVYTIEGELLKILEDVGDDEILDVDISDEVIVSTSIATNKTHMFSNTAPNFEKIAEVEQGGFVVATSGNKIVIGNQMADDNDGSAWLYNTDGTPLENLSRHDSASDSRFGTSVAITDKHVVVGAPMDGEGGYKTGSVLIYSSITGELIEKITAPDGEANDYFGSCSSAFDSYYTVGAPYVDVAYLFQLSE